MYRKHLRPVIFVMGVIVISSLLIGFRQPITNQLHSWKVLPQPERLTELYFTYPNNLPTKYTAGGSQTVQFTVHNLEYRPTNYRYQIVQTTEDGTTRQTLATGSFRLRQNQFAHPAVSITTADLGQRVKVEVQLINVNETISYWAGKEGA